jgi:hypothetical protein
MDDYAMTTAPRILFRRGFKYQLHQDYAIQVESVIPVPSAGLDGVTTPWLSFTPQGQLTIKAGYAWDGPSGPTKDSSSAMRGALVHDALYQLMRMRMIHLDFRDEIDNLFWRIIREDGMNRVRAFFWWRAVRRFAGDAASDEQRPVEAAP